MIIVAGVPGTGKTVVGSRLARRLNRGFTTLTWLVLEKGLWSSYDPVRRSFVVDELKLCSVLSGLSGRIVFETHWLEIVEICRLSVEYVVVTRTHPLELYRRLARRGWPRRKVVENVEAEFVGVIAFEAAKLMEKGVPVLEVDTSHAGPAEVVTEIIKGIRRGSIRCCIDWAGVLSSEELWRVMKLLNTASI